MTAPTISVSRVPIAFLGDYWLLYVLGYNISVAVSVEIGVIMLVYLNQAYRRHIIEKERVHIPSVEELKALCCGCVLS